MHVHMYQSHAQQSCVQPSQALKHPSTVKQKFLQLVLDGLGIRWLTSLDQLFPMLEQIVQSACTLRNCLLESLKD